MIYFSFKQTMEKEAESNTHMKTDCEANGKEKDNSEIHQAIDCDKDVVKTDDLTVENISIADNVSNSEFSEASGSISNKDTNIENSQVTAKSEIEKGANDMASESSDGDNDKVEAENEDSEESDASSSDEFESAEEGEEIQVDAQNLREMEENLTDEQKEVNSVNPICLKVIYFFKPYTCLNVFTVLCKPNFWFFWIVNFRIQYNLVFVSVLRLLLFQYLSMCPILIVLTVSKIYKCSIV